MGPPGSGQTSLLRESLRDFQVKKVGGIGTRCYYELPQWNGCLIGCNDIFPDFGSYQEVRDADGDPNEIDTSDWTDAQWRLSLKRSSQRLHSGIDEDFAMDVITQKRFDYVFCEGYTLGQRFAERAMDENYAPHVYWVEINPRTTKRRLSVVSKKHKAMTNQRRSLAMEMGATVINGEQQFEAVQADFLEAMLRDIAPPQVLGNLEAGTSAIGLAEWSRA